MNLQLVDLPAGQKTMAGVPVCLKHVGSNIIPFRLWANMSGGMIVGP